MRVLPLIVSAVAVLGAMAAPESLRGQERSLFVANYGGNAYNGRYPINACMNFVRYPKPTFTDCDGTAAAQAFCHKEGYARSLGFTLTSFRSLKSPASFCIGTQNVVEAGIHEDDHKVITEVQCDQV